MAALLEFYVLVIFVNMTFWLERCLYVLSLFSTETKSIENKEKVEKNISV